MKKKVKHLGLRVVSVVCGFAVFLSAGLLNAGAAVGEDEFGSMFRFNGVIFGDFAGLQADCEGALAVQGNAVFGSTKGGFDVAASAEPGGGDQMMGELYQDSSYPALLLGGLPVMNARAGVRGGHVAMKESNQDAFAQSGQSFDMGAGYGITYYDDDVIDAYFADAWAQATFLTDLFSAVEAEPITASQLKLLENTGLEVGVEPDFEIAGNVLVINVDSNQVGEINLPDEITAYDLIVFNIPGNSVTFGGGAVYYQNNIIDTSAPQDSTMHAICPVILWNCYEASSVSIEGYGVVGSLFAPYAEIHANGGSINGRLLAGGLTQQNGAEQHNFSMNLSDRLWELNPDPEGPDPEDPDPEAPDPEDPDPEDPDPEDPDPEDPDPEDPDPEDPDPEDPDPEDPDPEDPEPEDPDPEDPDPEDPDPEDPDPEDPDPEDPDPEDPDPEDPDPEKPVKERESERGKDTPGSDMPDQFAKSPDPSGIFAELELEPDPEPEPVPVIPEGNPNENPDTGFAEALSFAGIAGGLGTALGAAVLRFSKGKMGRE